MFWLCSSSCQEEADGEAEADTFNKEEENKEEENKEEEEEVWVQLV